MVAHLQESLRRTFDADDVGVISVYLFGSQAAGRAHRESDVDVGVLLDWGSYPDRARRFDARLKLSAHVGHAIGRNDVDIVILNDAPPHLARAIVSRGIRVFCRDAAADHAFVRTSLLRAADLEPFLRRTRRVKLAAIRR
jgi:predicted nucleotidyltransferase